jgi:hypothetical protein
MVLKLGATTVKHLLSKSLFIIANGQMQSHVLAALTPSTLTSSPTTLPPSQ